MTMPSARTRVTTDRAGRYLGQLCEHLSRISHHPRHGGGPPADAAPELRHVERSENHGVIEFASGTCLLRATGDELVVELVAVDASSLQALQQLLSARIETIGRRDDLTLTW